MPSFSHTLILCFMWGFFKVKLEAAKTEIQGHMQQGRKVHCESVDLSGDSENVRTVIQEVVVIKCGRSYYLSLCPRSLAQGFKASYARI